MTTTEIVRSTESTTTEIATTLSPQSEESNNITSLMDVEEFFEDTKPYDESTEGEEEPISIEQDLELTTTTTTTGDPPTRISQAINITEVDSSEGDYDDPFANLTVTGPELILPLKIVIPAVHIHYDRPEANQTFNKYEYIVFQSDNPAVHQHQNDSAATGDSSQLREIQLENSGPNSTLRVIGVDWPLQQLREILNTSAILYDDRTTQVYRRLGRYNASSIDELEEVSVGSKYAAWKRHQAEQAEMAKTEKRNFIRKHYERLIQWLSWQFDKS
ncbi:uncharacterized protein LOC129739189 [Uranotaenia lowii]|uniref:uncharacterized protein LOC129739189 n=1 Tax=Uranotaenia lowii TaxID=190385 RepID=UPI00247A2A17|nr:uncharacterized protein LOC129739189 [Uranotaenia lowii]